MQQNWGILNNITGRGRSWKRSISSNKKTPRTLTVAYRSVHCGYPQLTSLNEDLHLSTSSLSIYSSPPLSLLTLYYIHPIHFISGFHHISILFVQAHTSHAIINRPFVFPVASRINSWQRPLGRNVLFYKVFLYATISWENVYSTSTCIFFHFWRIGSWVLPESACSVLAESTLSSLMPWRRVMVLSFLLVKNISFNLLWVLEGTTTH